jgi:hypothetical protein
VPTTGFSLPLPERAAIHVHARAAASVALAQLRHCTAAKRHAEEADSLASIRSEIACNFGTDAMAR